MYVFMYVIYILRGNLAKLKSVISCDPMEMMRDFFFFNQSVKPGIPHVSRLNKKKLKSLPLHVHLTVSPLQRWFLASAMITVLLTHLSNLLLPSTGGTWYCITATSGECKRF